MEAIEPARSCIWRCWSVGSCYWPASSPPGWRTRVGFPSLLLFLGVGVIIGEDGLGLQFDDDELAEQPRHRRVGRSS